MALRLTYRQSVHALASRVLPVIPSRTCRLNSSAAAVAIPSVAEDKYAIIDVGGMKQIVEEGMWFACSKKAIQATAGSKIEFKKVVALREDGEYYKGRPYLGNVVVEAELLEEYEEPAAAGFTASGMKANTLGKVLVTRIRHAGDRLPSESVAQHN